MNASLDSVGPALATADHTLEREYSPSSCIGGNYQPFVAAYASQSRMAQERSIASGARWVELRYGSAAAQRLDVCLPPRPAPAPPGGCALLVFIHGGYWQELSAHDSLFAAADCAAQGHAFCAMDYTLAPDASLGQIVDECRAALQLLVAQAPQLGVDATRIVVAGSSAGAHLAAMVGLAGWRHAEAAQFRPRAVVLVSGIYRLEPLLGTSINHALGLDVQSAQAQSPALHDLVGFPPAVLCWGEIETAAFKSQSRDFAGAVERAGSACTTFEVAGRNHFDVVMDLCNPAATLGRKTLALLKSPVAAGMAKS